MCMAHSYRYLLCHWYVLPNMCIKTMSLTGALNCLVQEPDHVDNLPKNSRPTRLRHWKPALDSLWRGTISSFWQTDRRCLREATSSTNVRNSERYRAAVACNTKFVRHSLRHIKPMYSSLTCDFLQSPRKENMLRCAFMCFFLLLFHPVRCK